MGAEDVGHVVGRSVSVLRQATGLTQSELAGAMNSVGFGWSRSTVAEIEGGIRSVQVDELLALASYFEIPLWFLMAGPGQRLAGVRLGGRELSLPEWLALVTDYRGSDEPASPEVRKVIDSLWGGVTRPWAKVWRRQGGRAGPAYRAAREGLLALRARFPGPTYELTGDQPMSVSYTAGPWGLSVDLKMRPGEPYVARDDAEAEVLAGLEEQGQVRRIAAYQAYRMRRRKQR